MGLSAGTVSCRLSYPGSRPDRACFTPPLAPSLSCIVAHVSSRDARAPSGRSVRARASKKTPRRVYIYYYLSYYRPIGIRRKKNSTILTPIELTMTISYGCDNNRGRAPIHSESQPPSTVGCGLSSLLPVCP